jgi:hypothetical protein
VASLLFCFAPIVNVLISHVIEPPATRPSGLFFVGSVLSAALGDAIPKLTVNPLAPIVMRRE